MELFIILLIILIFLLFPVLKTSFKIWMQMRQMKKNFETAGQRSTYGSSSYGNYYGSSSDNNRHRHRHSRKIFSSSDGEYVDFEEIFEERVVSEYTETRDVEPRVSDAKYEEIR